MKNSLLITSPLCALAMLYALGILRVLVLGPGDVPATFHEHGFAYTLYDQKRAPSSGSLCLPCRFCSFPLSV
jgi:hypothetical protein